MNRNDREFIAQNIRAQYMTKSSEQNELEALKSLDAKVKRPANIFGYVWGSVSALIMGAGMSLTMTDIGTTLGIGAFMPVGIITGVIGMIMAIATYPVYKKILSSRKEKYADEILRISDNIIKEDN